MVHKGLIRVDAEVGTSLERGGMSDSFLHGRLGAACHLCTGRVQQSVNKFVSASENSLFN
jgi:hypothetical protein